MDFLMKESLKNILYEMAKPSLKRIGRFNKIHHGESCYIFGDGVSVKSMDLGLLGDKIGIAVNYFPLHRDINLTNCQYCIINAPFFFSPFLGYPRLQKLHMNKMARIYKELIYQNHQRSYFIDLSNFPFLRGGNIFHTFKKIPDRKLANNFIGNQIDCFSGVNRAAIMLSIYMGFDHIYLIGFDYTHIPSRSLHWYEKGSGVYYPQDNYNEDFFKIAKEFVEITSVTLDGKCKGINSITYKDFTGVNPIYRENTELIDGKYLDSLATWPGYTIY